MGLMRRAKQRRRVLAQSIQESARTERQKQNGIRSSLSLLASNSGSPGDSVGRLKDPGDTVPAPLLPPQKRQSLPAGFDNEKSQVENPTGIKRKREVSGAIDDQGTPSYTKIHHKRSRIIGDSIMSAPPRPRTRTPYKSRMDVSKVRDGSLLSDILMKQARRLAPNARSDTTRTDYFQLKALGIDPDTPAIPSTKKRTRFKMEVDGAESLRGTPLSNPDPSPSRRLPTSHPGPQTQSDSTQVSVPANDDDDEELFAQIRSIREALAESEQWCKSEKESLEKSMTPQPANPPPSTTITKETPAQKRLREIRERGRTPSRSEVRLRAMGDKALLPKGFWDGEGMGLSLVAGKGKGKGTGKDVTVASPLPPSRQRGGQQVGVAAPRGFAAFERRAMIPNGAGLKGASLPATGRGEQQQHTQREQDRKGSNAEDAIEL